MKKDALVIAAALLAGCASSTEIVSTESSDGSLTVRIDAASVANCRANGGCGLYSRTELLEIAKEAAAAGARQSCPAKSATPI